MPIHDHAHASTHRELERTWAPDDEAELPDLTALPGVAGVGSPPSQELVATYVDTDDLALTRAGISLRRRAGGTDEGWHLKLPSDGGADPAPAREELRRPLGGAEATPPVDLRRVVEGRVRGRDLRPVAEIRTRRTVHDLRAPDGRVLAELSDDRVEARGLVGAARSRNGRSPGAEPGGGLVAWREWELEIVDGDPTLLTAADEVFARADVHPSGVQRKIEVVLGDRLAAHLAVSADLDGGRPSPGGPAREVLRARLVRQAAALLRHDLGMRRGTPDSMHQARVACRRLRSALATYRPLLDRHRTDPLREELRWVARSLGEARDAEVASELIVGLLDAQPRRLVRGPVRRRLRRSFREAERRSGGATREVLSSQRYLTLLEDLERLVADPPWTEVAGRSAAEVLLPRVRKDWKRLRRRVEAAEAAASGAHEDGAGAAAREYGEALHAARKAAKRLRYACETVEPVWGGDAKRLRRAAKSITQVLGDRQDSTVSREHLLAAADAAEQAGESAFTWGRLHGLEEARAQERERRFWRETWPAARRKKLRRWLRP